MVHTGARIHRVYTRKLLLGILSRQQTPRVSTRELDLIQVTVPLKSNTKTMTIYYSLDQAELDPLQSTLSG